MRRRTLCKYRSKLELQSFREFSIDESKPYAELWMGTHPKSPAVLSSTGERLADHISANPESELGKHVTEKFGSNLPFLLKILSVNQALSIQGLLKHRKQSRSNFFSAHPNKKHAEELHAKDPAHYPDANHKPEMCIALTEFTGLCGFRPQNETLGFVNSIPELKELIGDVDLSSEESYSDNLKKAFTNLMQNSKDTIIEKVGPSSFSENPSKHYPYLGKCPCGSSKGRYFR